QAEDGARHPVRFDRPWTLATMPQLGWGDRLRAAVRVAPLLARRGPGPFTLDELAADEDGATLADWGRGLLGEGGYEHVLRPLMSPLTGADPEVISAGFTRALLHQVTRTQLTVHDGGMGAISRWLLEDAMGAEVRLSTPVRGVEHDADGVRVVLDD